MSIEQYKRITRIHKTLGNRQLNELLRFSAANPEMQDLHDVLVIVSSTGIRVGELSELRWADVDFQLQDLEVSSSGCSRRRIPFGSDTLRILKDRVARQPESKYVLGISPRALINRVSRLLASVSSSLGIAKVSLHALRENFVLRLLNSGNDMAYVARISDLGGVLV
jgi:site-specific recombinase XerD